MAHKISFPLAARLALAAIFVALLGLSGRARLVENELKLAEHALEVGAPLAAAEHYRNVAAHEPWRAELWLAAARSALQGGDLESALADFDHPNVRTQLTAADLLALGDASEDAGNAAAAVAFWQRAQYHGAPALEVSQRRLVLHQMQKDFPAQVEDLRQLSRLAPATAIYPYRLGLLLSAIDPPAALAPLEQAAALDAGLAKPALRLQEEVRTGLLAEDPGFSFLLGGRVLAALGEWELAALAFTNGTQRSPELAENWAYLGEARQHLNPPDLPGAQEALEQAARLSPQSLAANALLGLYWKRTGQPLQAAPYLSQTSALDSQNPLWCVLLSETYADMGMLGAAEASAIRAVELAPNQSHYRLLLAQFYLTNQIRVKDAGLDAARQAVLLAPEDPAALDVMGQALLYLGDVESAMRFFQRALRQDPAYAPALLHIGLAYVDLGQNQQGFAMLDRARQLAQDAAITEQAERLLGYLFP